MLWEAASHKVIFDALANEETFLGTAENVTLEDCSREGMMAPNLPPGSEERHAEIMPELSDYVSRMQLRGWPEVPLFEYTEPKVRCGYLMNVTSKDHDSFHWSV